MEPDRRTPFARKAAFAARTGCRPCPGRIFGETGKVFRANVYATACGEIEEALERIARFVQRTREI